MLFIILTARLIQNGWYIEEIRYGPCPYPELPESLACYEEDTEEQDIYIGKDRRFWKSQDSKCAKLAGDDLIESRVYAVIKFLSKILGVKHLKNKHEWNQKESRLIFYGLLSPYLNRVDSYIFQLLLTSDSRFVGVSRITKYFSGLNSPCEKIVEEDLTFNKEKCTRKVISTDESFDHKDKNAFDSVKPPNADDGDVEIEDNAVDREMSPSFDDIMMLSQDLKKEYNMNITASTNKALRAGSKLPNDNRGLSLSKKGNDRTSDHLKRILDYSTRHPTHFISSGHHLLSPFVFPVINVPIHTLMRYEILRIRSYNRHNTILIHSVTQLAQNGFYLSAGMEGEVTCFNCEVSHPNFLAGMSLNESAHRENCANERRLKNVALFLGTQGLTAADLRLFNGVYGESLQSGKLFIQQEPTDAIQVYFVYTSKSQPLEEPVKTLANSQFLRVYRENPSDFDFLDLSNAAYPLFANRRTRTETFQSWDPTHTQKPDVLVNLGFFYAGYSDCARCFYCGLGLKYWRPNDDAAYQHARFRPHCKYNLFVMGQSYVNDVHRMSGDSQGASGNAASNAASTTPNAPSVPEVRNIEQLMQSDAARKVIAEGWATQDVRAGVAQLVRNLGEECLVYDILIEVLTNLQEQPSSDNTQQGEEPHDGVQSSQDNAENVGSNENTFEDSGNPSAAVEDVETLEPDLLLRLVERENNYLKKRLHCMVCGNEKIGCIYLPCGHVVACQKCGDLASTCVLCNKVISAMASTYLA